MKERYKALVAVFLILEKNGENSNKKEVLLQKRQNTGYMDGMYDLSATGHLEKNESLKDAMVREAKEELGINIKKEDLELVTIFHEGDYIRVFFRAKKYEGEPKIGEPNKCSELLWTDINNLPDNTIYHIKQAILNIFSNINYFDQGF